LRKCEVVVVLIASGRVDYVSMKADFMGYVVDIDLLGGHRERIQGNEDVVQTKPLHSHSCAAITMACSSACLPSRPGYGTALAIIPKREARALTWFTAGTATTPTPRSSATSSQEFNSTAQKGFRMIRKRLRRSGILPYLLYQKVSVIYQRNEIDGRLKE
jgi:hypothetical protein